MSFDGSSQVGIVSNTSPDYNQPSLPVSQIRRDGGTQVRIAQNQFTIDEYAEKMVAGAIFPPVVVFFDGSEYWLADGFHRINAAIQAGIEHINVDIKEGDKRDAILYAVGANSSHGLRRTNEDKRNAVMLLLNDPEWVEWSDYEIAKACAVSRSLVQTIRDSLAFKASEKSERTYTTKHGTVARMNTERIGKTANIAPEVRELIRDTPIIENTDDLTRLSSLEPEKQKEVVEKVISGESKDVKSSLSKITLESAKNAIITTSSETDVELSIHHGDCVEWLSSLDRCADLLITDPPYATDVDDIETFAQSWLPIALSKVKATGRAYVCIGAYPEELKAYLNVDPGELELCQVLVWTYRNTLGPSPKDQYKLNWQAILYYKGPDAPPLNCPIMTEQFSVQDINAPDNRHGEYERWHAWQKPDELANRLIRHSTNEGDLIIDPFSGTGTFIIAAKKLNRDAIGCDQSRDMIDIAYSRRGVLSEC